MSYKNRGMFLESLINKTLKIYADHNIGIFHKKNVPVVFSGIKDQMKGKPEITKGWIASKSTTDYYGVYKGKFVTFEAKSTNLNCLPLSNIKEHQIIYINKIIQHDGIGFFIVGFSEYDEYFLVTMDIIQESQGKSLSIETCRQYAYHLELVYPGILDFAPIIEKLV